MNQIILSPEQIPLVSRQNAFEFHHQVKHQIKETGNGLFEYLEFLKFCEKLQEVISGNSSAKITADPEIREMIRDEVSKYGKEGFTTARGAKFQLAEVGYKYDFSKCGDPEVLHLQAEVDKATAVLKMRQEMLKAIPPDGVNLMIGDELIHVFPPVKTSTSSYKITLPK